MLIKSKMLSNIIFEKLYNFNKLIKRLFIILKSSRINNNNKALAKAKK